MRVARAARTSTPRRATSPPRSSGSRDEGISRGEIAVFYRTNAQSRVLEDTLVRADVAYQVIGGTKFYERAEIKDALAYLTLLTNPADSVSFGRVVNTPKRGIGQTTVGRVLAHANTMGEPVMEIAAVPELVPGLGPAAVKALDRFASIVERLRELTEHASVGDLLESVLQETGYVEALEAERTIEAQGRIENLQELVGVAREFDANWEGERGAPRAGRVPPAAVALLGAGRAARRREHGHADDAPQREGPRVPGRVHDRLRGGRVPALALDRRGQPGGGAAPLLRRHHARGTASLQQDQPERVDQQQQPAQHHRLHPASQETGREVSVADATPYVEKRLAEVSRRLSMRVTGPWTVSAIAPEGRKLLWRLEVRNAQTPIEKKPAWIKTRARMGPEYTELKVLCSGRACTPSCQAAGCPNIFECWEDPRRRSSSAATSARGAVTSARSTGKPAPLDRDEPRRVAESVQAMGLRYATVTGVARDDLPDGGAWLYAETVRQIHASTPAPASRS